MSGKNSFKRFVSKSPKETTCKIQLFNGTVLISKFECLRNITTISEVILHKIPDFESRNVTIEAWFVSSDVLTARPDDPLGDKKIQIPGTLLRSLDLKLVQKSIIEKCRKAGRSNVNARLKKNITIVVEN